MRIRISDICVKGGRIQIETLPCRDARHLELAQLTTAALRRYLRVSLVKVIVGWLAVAVMSGLVSLPVYVLLKMRSGKLTTHFVSIDREKNPTLWALHQAIAIVGLLLFGAVLVTTVVGLLSSL